MEDTFRELLVQERRGTRHHERPWPFFNPIGFYSQLTTIVLLFPLPDPFVNTTRSKKA
jgi:hypothetical protein